MEEALLEVRDLTSYIDTPHGVVRAVDGMSFAVQRGKTLGIVGESGSGKTVLSRTVMRLIPKPHTIVSGSVRLEGQELLTLTDRQMQRIWGAKMAMVFQDPTASLNPVRRVGDQIAGPLRHHLGLAKTEAVDRAMALLLAVGIPDPLRRVRSYPHQLSGGMRQRVMIAMALACTPKLVFADEPTTALDVTVQAQILDLLQELQHQHRMGLVLITHDLGVVAGRADDVIVMYAGKAVEKGPARTLFRNVRHPYTEALLGSIPRLDQPSHTRLSPIAGRPPRLTAEPEGCSFAPRCAYAQDRCRHEEPRLLTGADPRHEYACFFPVGGAERT